MVDLAIARHDRHEHDHDADVLALVDAWKRTYESWACLTDSSSMVSSCLPSVSTPPDSPRPLQLPSPGSRPLLALLGRAFGFLDDLMERGVLPALLCYRAAFLLLHSDVGLLEAFDFYECAEERQVSMLGHLRELHQATLPAQPDAEREQDAAAALAHVEQARRENLHAFVDYVSSRVLSDADAVLLYLDDTTITSRPMLLPTDLSLFSALQLLQPRHWCPDNTEDTVLLLDHSLFDVPSQWYLQQRDHLVQDAHSSGLRSSIAALFRALSHSALLTHGQYLVLTHQACLAGNSVLLAGWSLCVQESERGVPIHRVVRAWVEFWQLVHLTLAKHWASVDDYFARRLVSQLGNEDELLPSCDRDYLFYLIQQGDAEVHAALDVFDNNRRIDELVTTLRVLGSDWRAHISHTAVVDAVEALWHDSIVGLEFKEAVEYLAYSEREYFDRVVQAAVKRIRPSAAILGAQTPHEIAYDVVYILLDTLDVTQVEGMQLQVYHQLACDTVDALMSSFEISLAGLICLRSALGTSHQECDPVILAAAAQFEATQDAHDFCDTLVRLSHRWRRISPWLSPPLASVPRLLHHRGALNLAATEFMELLLYEGNPQLVQVTIDLFCSRPSPSKWLNFWIFLGSLLFRYSNHKLRIVTPLDIWRATVTASCAAGALAPADADYILVAIASGDAFVMRFFLSLHFRTPSPLPSQTGAGWNFQSRSHAFSQPGGPLPRFAGRQPHLEAHFRELALKGWRARPGIAPHLATIHAAFRSQQDERPRQLLFHQVHTLEQMLLNGDRALLRLLSRVGSPTPAALCSLLESDVTQLAVTLTTSPVSSYYDRTPSVGSPSCGLSPTLSAASSVFSSAFVYPASSAVSALHTIISYVHSSNPRGWPPAYVMHLLHLARTKHPVLVSALEMYVRAHENMDHGSGQHSKLKLGCMLPRKRLARAEATDTLTRLASRWTQSVKRPELLALMQGIDDALCSEDTEPELRLGVSELQVLHGLIYSEHEDAIAAGTWLLNAGDRPFIEDFHAVCVDVLEKHVSDHFNARLKETAVTCVERTVGSPAPSALRTPSLLTSPSVDTMATATSTTTMLSFLSTSFTGTNAGAEFVRMQQQQQQQEQQPQQPATPLHRYSPVETAFLRDLASNSDPVLLACVDLYQASVSSTTVDLSYDLFDEQSTDTSTGAWEELCDSLARLSTRWVKEVCDPPLLHFLHDLRDTARISHAACEELELLLYRQDSHLLQLWHHYVVGCRASLSIAWLVFLDGLADLFATSPGLAHVAEDERPHGTRKALLGWIESAVNGVQHASLSAAEGQVISAAVSDRSTPLDSDLLHAYHDVSLSTNPEQRSSALRRLEASVAQLLLRWREASPYSDVLATLSRWFSTKRIMRCEYDALELLIVQRDQELLAALHDSSDEESLWRAVNHLLEMKILRRVPSYTAWLSTFLQNMAYRRCTRLRAADVRYLLEMCRFGDPVVLAAMDLCFERGVNDPAAIEDLIETLYFASERWRRDFAAAYPRCSQAIEEMGFRTLLASEQIDLLIQLIYDRDERIIAILDAFEAVEPSEVSGSESAPFSEAVGRGEAFHDFVEAVRRRCLYAQQFINDSVVAEVRAFIAQDPPPPLVQKHIKSPTDLYFLRSLAAQHPPNLELVLVFASNSDDDERMARFAHIASSWRTEPHASPQAVDLLSIVTRLYSNRVIPHEALLALELRILAQDPVLFAAHTVALTVTGEVLGVVNRRSDTSHTSSHSSRFSSLLTDSDTSDYESSAEASAPATPTSSSQAWSDSLAVSTETSESAEPPARPPPSSAGRATPGFIVRTLSTVSDETPHHSVFTSALPDQEPSDTVVPPLKFDSAEPVRPRRKPLSARPRSRNHDRRRRKRPTHRRAHSLHSPNPGTQFSALAWIEFWDTLSRIVLHDTGVRLNDQITHLVGVFDELLHYQRLSPAEHKFLVTIVGRGVDDLPHWARGAGERVSRELMRQFFAAHRDGQWRKFRRLVTDQLARSWEQSSPVSNLVAFVHELFRGEELTRSEMEWLLLELYNGDAALVTSTQHVLRTQGDEAARLALKEHAMEAQRRKRDELAPQVLEYLSQLRDQFLVPTSDFAFLCRLCETRDVRLFDLFAAALFVQIRPPAQQQQQQQQPRQQQLRPPPPASGSESSSSFSSTTCSTCTSTLTCSTCSESQWSSSASVTYPSPERLSASSLSPTSASAYVPRLADQASEWERVRANVIRLGKRWRDEASAASPFQAALLRTLNYFQTRFYFSKSDVDTLETLAYQRDRSLRATFARYCQDHDWSRFYAALTNLLERESLRDYEWSCRMAEEHFRFACRRLHETGLVSPADQLYLNSLYEDRDAVLMSSLALLTDGGNEVELLDTLRRLCTRWRRQLLEPEARGGDAVRGGLLTLSTRLRSSGALPAAACDVLDVLVFESNDVLLAVYAVYAERMPQLQGQSAHMHHTEQVLAWYDMWETLLLLLSRYMPEADLPRRGRDEFLQTCISQLRGKLLHRTDIEFLEGLVERGDVALEAAFSLYIEGRALEAIKPDEVRLRHSYHEFSSTLCHIAHRWRRKSRHKFLLRFVRTMEDQRALVRMEVDYIYHLIFHSDEELLEAWRTYIQNRYHFLRSGRMAWTHPKLWRESWLREARRQQAQSNGDPSQGHVPPMARSASQPVRGSYEDGEEDDEDAPVPRARRHSHSRLQRGRASAPSIFAVDLDPAHEWVTKNATAQLLASMHEIVERRLNSVLDACAAHAYRLVKELDRESRRIESRAVLERPMPVADYLHLRHLIQVRDPVLLACVCATDELSDSLLHDDPAEIEAMLPPLTAEVRDSLLRLSRRWRRVSGDDVSGVLQVLSELRSRKQLAVHELDELEVLVYRQNAELMSAYRRWVDSRFQLQVAQQLDPSGLLAPQYHAHSAQVWAYLWQTMKTVCAAQLTQHMHSFSTVAVVYMERILRRPRHFGLTAAGAQFLKQLLDESDATLMAAFAAFVDTWQLDELCDTLQRLSMRWRRKLLDEGEDAGCMRLLEFVDKLRHGGHVTYIVGETLELLVFQRNPAVLAAFDVYEADLANGELKTVAWVELWDSMSRILSSLGFDKQRADQDSAKASALVVSRNATLAAQGQVTVANQQHRIVVGAPAQRTANAAKLGVTTELATMEDRIERHVQLMRRKRMISTTEQRALLELLRSPKGHTELEEAYLEFLARAQQPISAAANREMFHDQLFALASRWRQRSEHRLLLEFLLSLPEHADRLVTFGQWDFLEWLVFSGDERLPRKWDSLLQRQAHGLLADGSLGDRMYEHVCNVLGSEHASRCLQLFKLGRNVIDFLHTNSLSYNLPLADYQHLVDLLSEWVMQPTDPYYVPQAAPAATDEPTALVPRPVLYAALAVYQETRDIVELVDTLLVLGSRWRRDTTAPPEVHTLIEVIRHLVDARSLLRAQAELLELEVYTRNPILFDACERLRDWNFVERDWHGMLRLMTSVLEQAEARKRVALLRRAKGVVERMFADGDVSLAGYTYLVQLLSADEMSMGAEHADPVVWAAMAVFEETHNVDELRDTLQRLGRRWTHEAQSEAQQLVVLIDSLAEDGSISLPIQHALEWRVYLGDPVLLAAASIFFEEQASGQANAWWEFWDTLTHIVAGDSVLAQMRAERKTKDDNVDFHEHPEWWQRGTQLLTAKQRMFDCIDALEARAGISAGAPSFYGPQAGQVAYGRLSDAGALFLRHVVEHGGVPAMDTAWLRFRDTQDLDEFHSAMLQVAHGWREWAVANLALPEGVDRLLAFFDHICLMGLVTTTEWNMLERMVFVQRPRLLAIWSAYMTRSERAGANMEAQQHLSTELFHAVLSLLEEAALDEFATLREDAEAFIRDMHAQQQFLLQQQRIPTSTLLALSDLLDGNDPVLFACIAVSLETQDAQELLDSLLRLGHRSWLGPQADPLVPGFSNETFFAILDSMHVRHGGPLLHGSVDWLQALMYRRDEALCLALAGLAHSGFSAEALLAFEGRAEAILDAVHSREVIRLCSVGMHIAHKMARSELPEVEAEHLDLLARIGDPVLAAIVSQYEETGDTEDMHDSILRLGRTWRHRDAATRELVEIVAYLTEQRHITPALGHDIEQLVFHEHEPLMGAYARFDQERSRVGGSLAWPILWDQLVTICRDLVTAAAAPADDHLRAAINFLWHQQLISPVQASFLSELAGRKHPRVLQALEESREMGNYDTLRHTLLSLAPLWAYDVEDEWADVLDVVASLTSEGALSEEHHAAIEVLVYEQRPELAEAFAQLRDEHFGGLAQARFLERVRGLAEGSSHAVAPSLPPHSLQLVMFDE